MPDAERITFAVYEACRPHMVEESFCVNAAAVMRLVLPFYGVQSWPVQCTVLHANAAYAEHVRLGRPEDELPPYWEAGPGDPYCIWARAEVGWRARTAADQLDASARKGRQGLPGHVVTWVPDWGCYLDPTAGQFNRPDRGIELEPTVWEPFEPPPASGEWRRRDGGVTILHPTTLRGYAHAGAWLHRNDQITRKLAYDAQQILKGETP